jgi:2-dehydropantoate 2-reductase
MRSFYSGTIDEVTSSLFDQPSSRPNYLGGILNHGVYTTGPFSAVHAGFADTILGLVPPPSTEAPTGLKQSETAFLIQQILNAPMLAASLVSPSEFLQAQLQKLAINAIINPLTVIFDCFNGELFHSTAIRVLIQAIISELSTVIRAIITSRNENLDPAVLARFSPENLEKVVSDVGAKTAKNVSSMRQDVRAGRKTEIDYINGYIIAQGAHYGIECPQNSKLVDLVKGKTLISEFQIPQVFGI